MVHSMKPGSVIVDLAVEQGGNCTLSKPGEVVDVNGVRIVGHLNVPSRLATDASALYAKNLLSFISPLINAENGTLQDRKSTRLNSSHVAISYAVFCLKKKRNK